MRNKKLFSILMVLCMAVTYCISLSTINVFAAEPETYGNELTDDQIIDLAEEADPYLTDPVTVTFILGGGLESVMVQDVDNAEVDAEGNLIINDSLYQSISNGGTMTMNGGSGFAVKQLDSGQQLRAVIADSAEEAQSDSGTIAISRPGEALRAAINNENTWIYLTPGTFETNDNPGEDANGDLIWPLEGDDDIETTPDFPTAKQPIPYKKGKTYTGSAYALTPHFNVGHSRTTYRHTSGILKDIGKDITASCYDHDRGLGAKNAPFTYRCKVLKVNENQRKIKVTIKYFPKKRYTTLWGYKTTVTSRRTSLPQRHKWTGWVSLKPKTGYIQAQKKSENQISSGLSTYSIAGAEYQVFTDANCTTGAECVDGSPAILVTGENGLSPKKELEKGTYYVKELKAPKGHARTDVVKKVIVNISNTEDKPVVFDYTDPEKYGNIKIRKLDTELDRFYSEGDAKIETVKWEISYYDNYTGAGSPKRTWIFSTTDADKNEKDLTEDRFVSGDALYKVNGKMVFPLGYYKIREITPEGYVPNDTIMETALPDTKGNTSTETFMGTIAFERKNQVIRGGLAFEKHDAETRAHWPMGGATFKGTTFEIINSSRHFIYYKKNGNFVLENGKPKEFKPGEVIDTVKIKKDGEPITLDKDALPYGTYTIREIAVDDLEQKHGSYLPTEIENQTILTIKVRNDGTIHTTTDEVNNGNTQDHFYNYVKRGDINLIKNKAAVNGQNPYLLKGIPFVIKSKTTGEAHVIVTLDNSGYLTTSSDVIPHTDDTNANDYMIDEQGMPILNENGWVDMSKVNYYAGLWWGKDSKGNETLKVDNSKGALPYDTYEIYELPCERNEGYKLFSDTFDITRHELVYRDTILNVPPGYIGTKAKDAVTLDSFGSSESDSIIDTIEYHDFTKGTYLVRTTLMDKSTQKPVQVDGKDLVVEKKVTFGEGEGEVNVEIKFPKNHLRGKAVVVFEEVWELDEAGNPKDSKPVTPKVIDSYAEHKKITDEGQTVLYPDMHTTAKDKVDFEKDIFANGTQTIVDTVEYKALQPGKEHVLKGVLMDKETGEPLKDANGNEITAEKTFTPESYNGTVDVEFTFDASLLEGKTVVVFENLYRDGKEILVHADIEDKDQSAYLPKIRTKFMTNDGEKDIDFSKLDTTPVPTGNDDPTVDPTQPANPSDPNPNADLDVNKTKELVVGKDIEAGYYKATGKCKGDASAYWSVFFNKDGSVPTERDSEHCAGNGGIKNGETQIIRVENNMVLQYTAANDRTVTFEKTDKVDNNDLFVSLALFYNSRWDDVNNKYKEDAPVAMAEADQNTTTDTQPTDTQQTTDTQQPTDNAQPTDTTQSTDTPAEPTSEESGDATVVLVDHVQYWNLIPGKEYEATVGIAKKDGTVLTDANGVPYEGHFTFVPTTPDGEYEVKLPPIPLSELKDDIVALEVLKSRPTKEDGTPDESKELKTVAEHKDLTDADQTIMIPKVSTSAKDQKDGDKAILGKPDQTLVDTMTYEGLIVGGNYIARGKLANPKTGEILKDKDGNEITAETKFVPTESSGTVEVVFNFDASDYMAGSIVVLEELYRVPEDTTKPERLVGWHKDLNDTDQTVDVFMELYVTIAKADAEKVKYFLKGAEITVFDGEGNIAKDKDGKDCVGITDKNGEVKFTLLYLEGMEFYAQETKAPKGYEINKEKFEVKPETLDEEGADILISILDQAIVIPPIKTGDDTNMMLYAILLLVALSAVGTTVFVRRRIKINQ